MSTQPNDQERRANKRNLRDLLRIERLHSAADECLHAIAFVDPLEHPDARLHPDDLRVALRGVLHNLAAELRLITEAQTLVLDDPDITADVVEATHYE